MIILKKSLAVTKIISKRNWFKAKTLPWLMLLTLMICSLFAFFVYSYLVSNKEKDYDFTTILSNLLMVNGIFSAILMTYLFSRIIWLKEQKQDLYKKSVFISQKITDFRRILRKIFSSKNAWPDEKRTKNLIDYGKFKSIDFCDYNIKRISDFEPKNSHLINEFYNHPDFSEEVTVLYLAMASLVNIGKREYASQPELYKDFEHNFIYKLDVVERWIGSHIMSVICSRLDADQNHINYTALIKEKTEIMSAAKRIDKNYQEHELNNELIMNLADDMDSHYLKELHSNLLQLKVGLKGINLLLIIMITVSLSCGVLIPFLLLLCTSTEIWFSKAVALTAAVNSGLMIYLILIFPFLISKELKWVH